MGPRFGNHLKQMRCAHAPTTFEPAVQAKCPHDDNFRYAGWPTTTRARGTGDAGRLPRPATSRRREPHHDATMRRRLWNVRWQYRRRAGGFNFLRNGCSNSCQWNSSADKGRTESDRNRGAEVLLRSMLHALRGPGRGGIRSFIDFGKAGRMHTRVLMAEQGHPGGGPTCTVIMFDRAPIWR